MTWVQPNSGELVDLHPALGQRVHDICEHAAAATPGRTGELARIRVAQLLEGATSESLPTDLTPAEHAALAVIEQFIVDVHGLDDRTFASLSTFFTPAEQMGLLFHLALLDGFTKLNLVAADAPN
jgi:hypothetical protein